MTKVLLAGFFHAMKTSTKIRIGVIDWIRCDYGTGTERVTKASAKGRKHRKHSKLIDENRFLTVCLCVSDAHKSSADG